MNDRSPNHTCPRRAEMSIAHTGRVVAPASDTYDMRPGVGAPCCSYCGSVEPGAFMEAVRNGAEVGPTDKGYKVYIEGAGIKRGKFSPVHMSQAQGDEFRTLYSEGRINIGYPGHFYTPLYIPMTPADSADTTGAGA